MPAEASGSDRREGLFFLLGLAMLATGGLALVAYATAPGVGLVNDSAAYISGARSLLDGQGYARLGGDGGTRPLTHFPPLFSLLLAAIGLFGVETIPAARLAVLGLFLLNIFLTGLLGRQLTRSAWAGLLAAGLFALSEALLRVHTFALSEPLFLAVTLACLLCLGRVLAGRTGWSWPLAAGLLAGLAYLTRYVGVALLAAGLLVLLLQRRAWQNRLRRASWFLLGALPPVAAWSIRNALLTGSATNRGLAWHPIAPSELAEGLRNVWAFVLPSRLGLYERLPLGVWSVLIAGLLACFAGWVVARGVNVLRGRTAVTPVFLVGLHALAYLLPFS